MLPCGNNVPVVELLKQPLTDLRMRDEWWVWLSADPENDLSFNYEAEGLPVDDAEVECPEPVHDQFQPVLHRPEPEHWYDYVRDNIATEEMSTGGEPDIAKS